MQTTIFISILILSALLLSKWITVVVKNELHFLKPLLEPVEKLIYFLIGANPEKAMTWQVYLLCLLTFNFVGFISLLSILCFQDILPLNPQHLKAVPFPLAFNTAVSFITNTNWQAYPGESTLSHFSQMVGLGVQNFLSAATGICVLLALTRGLVNRGSVFVGNFWEDLTRTTLYILIPLSFILGVILVSQGVIQNFEPYRKIQTLEGKDQIIPSGPVASQVAIKQLGTNGGGYFGTNSAHPLENPTPLSNFLEILAILLIPAALPFVFGKLIDRPQDGGSLFLAMLSILLVGIVFSLWSETSGLYNMEGKEVRIGVEHSVLWSVATTAASNGSVNAMHSSLSPLSGMVSIFNIMLGEVIFGGVGSGLYGMLMFVIITVFIAGLMVGRSPEYLGKKIEKKEVIWATVAILLPSFVMLIGPAISVFTSGALAARSAHGPHGLMEIVYAWTSAAGNNGSAFAGLNANTDFYNYGLALAMIIGRFGVIIPAMAIAGSLSLKNPVPPSLGTFPTSGFTFVFLLLGTILIIGGLTFVPVLTLGPIIEYLLANPITPF